MSYLKNNLKPQSKIARDFLSLYRNPFISDLEIQKRINTSRSNFYKLKKQCGLPCYKVSLWAGAMRPCAQKKMQVNSFNYPLQYYNVFFLNELSHLIHARFDISFDSYKQLAAKLKDKKVDFSISGMTDLKGQKKCSNLFSHPYIDAKPFGSLFRLKNRVHIRPQSIGLVGVLVSSLHEMFFDILPKNLKKQKFIYMEKAINGIQSGKIEYIFCHPSNLKHSEIFERLPTNYFFDGTPAIAFNEQNLDLRKEVNLALDQMQEYGIYQKLNFNFKNHFI